MKERSDFSQVPIQAVKDFWDRRPCNVKHSRAAFGSKAYFDEVEKRKFFVEPHLVEFADFPSVKGKKVLEIGCGIGTTAVRFARAGAKKVIAVDVSERSLEIAKKQAEAYGVADRMEFFLANAEELSKAVPKEEYDLIFSFGVIHHTPHPEKIVEELQTYLKPDGTLKIMVYHRYSWKSLWILFRFGRLQFWNLRKLVAAYSEAQAGCPITYTYTKREGKDLLESKGFRVEEMRVSHIFPYKISDYIQHRYVKVWYFRILPPRFFRLMENHFGWHLCMTATKGLTRGVKR